MQTKFIVAKSKHGTTDKEIAKAKRVYHLTVLSNPRLARRFVKLAFIKAIGVFYRDVDTDLLLFKADISLAYGHKIIP